MTTISQESNNLAPTLLGIGLTVAAVMVGSLWGTAPRVASSLPPTTTKMQRSAFAKAAEAFVPNMGQWDGQALFLARSLGVDAWVTESGVVYDFFEARVEGTGSGVRGDGPTQDPAPKAQHTAQRRGHVVRMEFVGGIASPVRGEGPLEGRFNYFLGSDESRWAANVPRYAEARSERVYEGVEARWYFDQGKPRYDLIVAPGADPGKIQMRFEGASLGTDGKSLNIRTSLGDVRQSGLFAYQKIGGGTKQVPCSFAVRGNNASFKVGDYDTTKPLVIDPLLWATFLGGASTDATTDVALDDSGNALVAGYTHSSTFPTTVGAYDQTYAALADAFVAKVSANGANLLFGTYVGGVGGDLAWSIALDATSQIVIVGETRSTDFPTTAGTFDKTLGGVTDAFVAKLLADGSALVYSTYLGGTLEDSAKSVALDGSGVPILTGVTWSADFPTSATAFDQVFGGNDQFDAFAAKLKVDGSALLYGTYIGGSGADSGVSLAIDASGSAVILGSTNSANFPTTVGAFDQTVAGGDAFVVKVSSDGATLQYGTFLGGSLTELPKAVALDGAGNAYVTGQTTSIDFPTTAGALDQTIGGVVEAFVAKISADGSNLLHSTFLGGANVERGNDIAIDGHGNVVVAGYNFTGFFPVTAGAHDTTYNGSYDAFVARLSPDLSTLLYSSYLGGSFEDRVEALALDSSNNVLLSGIASSGFPATAGAFDESNNGANDAFVAHMAITPALMDATLPRSSFIGGFSVPMTVILNQPADPGDTIVALTTDNPGKVFVSQTKVKVGKTTKTFGVRTESVKVDTPVSITAICNGASKTVNFTLKPGGLLSLKLDPQSLSSFSFGSGRVILSAPAPAGARTVLLDSSKSSLLFVPVAVDVEVGETEAVFPTFAGPIAASTQVTVSARLGTMKKTATLTVNP